MKMKFIVCLCVAFGSGVQAFAIAKPNSDMKKVLAELAGKQGKPIESLSATEARQQPTPADAVQSLMFGHATKPDPTGFAKVQDIQVDGAAGKIPARLYVPVAKGPLPVVA